MGSDKKGPPVKAGHVTPGNSKSLVGLRVKGLEPSRIAALGPKTSVYTNFTTPALKWGDSNAICLFVVGPQSNNKAEI